MRFTAVALALLLAPAAAPRPAASDAAVEAELKRITNALLDAVAPGDVAVWKRYAHERLIYVTESNQVLTKAKLIEELKPLPKGLAGELEVADFHVAVHGNVAVATYIADERLDYHGQIVENDFRSTDTWLRTEDGWKLIASQVLAVLEDPPAVALPREVLCGYEGTYRLTADIVTKITCTADGLRSERTGRPAATFKAEVRDVFFQPGQPRTRRIFLRDERGAITAFVDRREGLDIRWTKVD